jgi:hypothetical protein
MLKIDRENRALELILPQMLIEAGLKEREDLQDLIERNPKVFFDEIGLGKAVLLGTEVQPARHMVGDRIDLLALDKDGAVIIIELKRGRGNKLHLLQAMSYAAMISKWQGDEFRALLKNGSPDLDDAAQINSYQRIILVADAFEYEVLTTAEWLVETYNLEILCIRLQVARDPASGAEYLVCERVYPPIEIEEHAVQRRAQNRGDPPPSGPAEIVKTPANADVSAFFEGQRAQAPYDDKNGAFRYVVGSKVAWSVVIRKRFASVWQYRRFSGDLDFWRTRLSNPEAVGEKDNERALSFPTGE